MRFRLVRQRLDNGGYDSVGRYYGIGKPLYEATCESIGPLEEDIWFEFRASDRAAAKEYVKAKYPTAVFYN